MTAPKYYTDNGFLNQLMDVYNEPQEEKEMTASTYPVKLIENLRKEIEDLKVENKRLSGRLTEAGWGAEQERQSWGEYHPCYPKWT